MRFQSPATYCLMAHPRMIRTASLVVAHPFPTKRFRMRMLRTSLLSLRMTLMWQKAPKIASQSQKRPQNQAPTRLRAAWMPRTLPRWTTMNAKTTPSWTSRSYGRRPPLAPVRRCGQERSCRTTATGTIRAGRSIAAGQRRTRCMTPKCMPISTRATGIRSMGKPVTWSCSMETADSRRWT